MATKTGFSPEVVQSSENVSLTGSLNTEGDLPVVSTYVLHPPLPSLPTSNVLPNTNTNAIVLPNSSNTTGYGLAEEGSIVTTAVPLLLDPELMKGTGIHIVTPQVHVSITFHCNLTDKPGLDPA